MVIAIDSAYYTTLSGLAEINTIYREIDMEVDRSIELEVLNSRLVIPSSCITSIGLSVYYRPVALVIV